jgi:hypothetical protein
MLDLGLQCVDCRFVCLVGITIFLIDTFQGTITPLLIPLDCFVILRQQCIN